MDLPNELWKLIIESDTETCKSWILVNKQSYRLVKQIPFILPIELWRNIIEHEWDSYKSWYLVNKKSRTIIDKIMDDWDDIDLQIRLVFLKAI